MEGISNTLTKAIKLAMWVEINYVNASDEQTTFWAAITGIKTNDKKLKITMFNDFHSDQTLDSTIAFERIKSARLLEGTTYSVPESLDKMLEKDDPKLRWLKYDHYDKNILDYLERAAMLDVNPYKRDTDLIDKINYDQLAETKSYQLNGAQFDQMVERIKKDNKKKQSAHIVEHHTLCINRLSVKTQKGLYVVVYHDVMFNPKTRTLVLDSEPKINETFLINQEAFDLITLRHILDVEAAEFLTYFKEEPKKYETLLMEALSYPQESDTRPYLFDLIRRPSVNLKKEFLAIHEMKEANALSIPIKAFFGMMSTRNLRKKTKPIALIDHRINIKQLQVIHNAFKQPLTYVQGPPGTGKTQTIVNIALNALLNDEKILISSHNNHPIDGIMEKLSTLTFNGEPIRIPVLRLGNYETMLEALNTIETLYKQVEKLSYKPKVLKKNRVVSSDYKRINDMLEEADTRTIILERIDVLNSLKKSFDKASSVRLLSIESEITELKKQLNRYHDYTNDDFIALLSKEKNHFIEWLHHYSIMTIQKLKTDRFKELRELFTITKDEKRYRQFMQFLADDLNMKRLLDVFPIVLTTNMSAPKLGSPKEHFDLVVIDEAGQCTLSYALLPVIRGNRLVLVGDPDQLEPVSTLDSALDQHLRNRYRVPKAYHYLKNSILTLMQSVDVISKFILLSYHYRSHEKIINYSNAKYYGNQLIIESAVESDLPLQFIDVSNDSETNYNASYEEARVIIEKVKAEHLESVGIITPFRNQVDILKRLAKDYGLHDVSIGTVHTYQGDEKEVIYLSLAITNQTRQKTFDWLKNNKELINVATTRAKSTLNIVGDKEAIKALSDEENDLEDLITYVEDKGLSVVRETTNSFHRGRNHLKELNSYYEEEFLKTITHIIDLNVELEIKDKIKVSSVFKTPDEYRDYYFKSEFDFVVYNKYTKKPLCAIELDGIEHELDENVRARDKKKEAICRNHGFLLLRIPNNYVRRYEFIKETLKKILKA